MEMVGQTLGDSEGQGGLACCSPWGLKELDMTGCLNNNNNNLNLPHFLVLKVSPIFSFRVPFRLILSPLYLMP